MGPRIIILDIILMSKMSLIIMLSMLFSFLVKMQSIQDNVCFASIYIYNKPPMGIKI